jgi:hypothetical protein
LSVLPFRYADRRVFEDLADDVATGFWIVEQLRLDDGGHREVIDEHMIDREPAGERTLGREQEEAMTTVSALLAPPIGLSQHPSGGQR